MRRAEGPIQNAKKEQKMIWQKNEKEGVRYRRQGAHEQLKQGKLQAGREDHHNSSTLHHMVSSRSNDEGNILR
jgi:hypothetical protein